MASKTNWVRQWNDFLASDWSMFGFRKSLEDSLLSNPYKEVIELLKENNRKDGGK